MAGGQAVEFIRPRQTPSGECVSWAQPDNSA